MAERDGFKEILKGEIVQEFSLKKKSFVKNKESFVRYCLVKHLFKFNGSCLDCRCFHSSNCKKNYFTKHGISRKMRIV